MDVDVLFVGVAVSDFDAARAWYERLFDRTADIVAHEAEEMWQVTDRGWLYIRRDVLRSGNAIVTMAVSDLERTSSTLKARGIAIEPIEREGDAGRKAVALDPDGNAVAFIEVSSSS
jgi:predicted enzyme related to lactoylglutathione lyase